MDYTPHRYKNQNGIQPSFKYKSKRALWFNSNFTSDFVLIDNKIYEISFDTNPFEIYKFNRLKVLSYIRDSNQSKPIQVKLKFPLAQSREVVNTDLETYPIIYNNHTGATAMHYNNKYSVRLVPQQIPRFIFRLDDNYNSFLSSSGSSVSYRIFNYTGTIQTFNIPDGVSSVNVYCWGAGGGSSVCVSGISNTYIPARGGNGGFVKATLIIPQGTTSLAVIVGQGGRKGVINSLSGKSFGGGGDGHAGNISWAIGGGGGLSGIFVNDANMTIVSSYQVNTNAIPFIITGGGGGAGGADALQNTSPNHGGNGGTDNGNDSSSSVIGGGGTQTTGGSGTVGNEGAKYRGGNGDNFSAGGGSGWYGGGTRDTPGGLVGGGGGGSSYINSSYTITNITNIKTTTNGTATVEGDKETYYQSGIGLGAPITNTTQGLVDGGNGLVVIEYFRSRIEGVTAQETLIQTTNASIPVTVNSKYVINYQTPVDLPKGTYESIFSNGSILLRNKKFPRPWGSYFAEDWSGTTLLDSSGNGRHATTSGTITKTSGFGNGANANITYLTGTTSSSITWPAGSIPSNFTILAFTRWNGGSRQRIIQSTTGNWLLGHHSDAGTKPGVAFFNNGWKTPVPSFANLDDWLCIIGKNDTRVTDFKANIVLDGVAICNQTGGIGNSTLAINPASSAEKSDWAFASVIIWDSLLTDYQMFELNRLIDDYKNTGRSIKNDLGLNFDYSYPILKDANNTTINPLVWYKFDTGNLLVDSSGNSYTLTNNGTVTINQNDFVKGNGSASFTSSSQWLNNSSFLNLSSRSWSISFWVKKTNDLTTDYLIKIGSGAVSYQTFVMYFDSANKLIVSNYNSTVETPAFSVANRWVHICFTYLTGTKRGSIYRDGVQIVQGTYNGEVSVDTNLYIGSLASVTVDNLKGSLDDVRIYQQELTSTQVSELYNGRIGIYSPPSFMLGVEMEDEKLSLINTISTNNRTDDT